MILAVLARHAYRLSYLIVHPVPTILRGRTRLLAIVLAWYHPRDAVLAHNRARGTNSLHRAAGRLYQLSAYTASPLEVAHSHDYCFFFFKLYGPPRVLPFFPTGPSPD